MPKPWVRDVFVEGQAPNFGKLILYDDFSNQLKWEISGTGTDYAAYLQTDVVLDGAYALKLKSRTTGSAADDYIRMTRRIFLPYAREIIIGFVWQWPSGGNFKEMHTLFMWDDQTNIHVAGLNYSDATEKWTYRTTGGSYLDVPDGSQDLGEDRWHYTEITLNYYSNEYGICYSDQLKMDLTGKPFSTMSSVTKTQFDFYVQFKCTSGGPVTVYIDKFIVRTR